MEGVPKPKPEEIPTPQPQAQEASSPFEKLNIFKKFQKRGQKVNEAIKYEAGIYAIEAAKDFKSNKQKEKEKEDSYRSDVGNKLKTFWKSGKYGVIGAAAGLALTTTGVGSLAVVATTALAITPKIVQSYKHNKMIKDNQKIIEDIIQLTGTTEAAAIAARKIRAAREESETGKLTEDEKKSIINKVTKEIEESKKSEAKEISHDKEIGMGEMLEKSERAVILKGVLLGTAISAGALAVRTLGRRAANRGAMGVVSAQFATAGVTAAIFGGAAGFIDKNKALKRQNFEQAYSSEEDTKSAKEERLKTAEEKLQKLKEKKDSDYEKLDKSQRKALNKEIRKAKNELKDAKDLATTYDRKNVHKLIDKLKSFEDNKDSLTDDDRKEIKEILADIEAREKVQENHRDKNGKKKIDLFSYGKKGEDDISARKNSAKDMEELKSRKERLYAILFLDEVSENDNDIKQEFDKKVAEIAEALEQDIQNKDKARRRAALKAGLKSGAIALATSTGITAVIGGAQHLLAGNSSESLFPHESSETANFENPEELQGIPAELEDAHIADVNNDGNVELIDKDGNVLVENIKVDPETGLPSNLDEINQEKGWDLHIEERETLVPANSRIEVNAAEYMENSDNGDVLRYTDIKYVNDSEAINFGTPTLYEDGYHIPIQGEVPEGVQFIVNIGTGGEALTADVINDGGNSYALLPSNTAIFDTINPNTNGYTGAWCGLGSTENGVLTSYGAIRLSEPFDGTFSMMGETEVSVDSHVLLNGDQVISTYEVPDTTYDTIDTGVLTPEGDPEQIELRLVRGGYDPSEDPFLDKSPDVASSNFGNAITTNDPVEAMEQWVVNVQKSPDQLVWNIASLGGFQNDPDVENFFTEYFGENWHETLGIDGAIDTEAEVNIIANQIAERPDACDGLRRLFLDELKERMAGGRVELREIAEGGRYSSLHQNNQFLADSSTDATGSIIRSTFATTGGVALVMTTADGENVFDDETTRSLLGVPEGRSVGETMIRLNCGGQHTRVIEKTTDEKQTGEKQTGEKQTGEKQTGEKQTGEKQTGEKQTGEKQVDEKQTDEKQIDEKQTGEKQTGEKQTSEKQTSEKQTGEKQTGEKQTGEKQTGEKQTGEKTTEELTGKGPNANAGPGARPMDETPYRPGTTYVEATPDNHVDPDIKPGSEVIGGDESVYSDNTVPDSNGEPMRDTSGNIYITNPDNSESSAEVAQNIADGTQTTYTSDTTDWVPNAPSDIPNTTANRGEVMSDSTAPNSTGTSSGNAGGGSSSSTSSSGNAGGGSSSTSSTSSTSSGGPSDAGGSTSSASANPASANPNDTNYSSSDLASIFSNIEGGQ